MPALDWERPHAKSGGMALNFIWLDWAMIVAFLLLTTGIAFMTRRLIANYDSFLLAGRSLKLYLGMATMGATELGLVTLMYFF